MTDLRKAAEMVCELWFNQGGITAATFKPYMEALRQALAQPEQEPVDVVKVEHARWVELAEMYQRGWDAALEKRKPVAWMYVNDDGECEQIEYGEPFDDPSVTPLYIAPPKREWVGLTDEEKDTQRLIDNDLLFNDAERQVWGIAIEWAEEKLKEKNT